MVPKGPWNKSFAESRSEYGWVSRTNFFNVPRSISKGISMIVRRFEA
jgi:hypothetical protein